MEEIIGFLIWFICDGVLEALLYIVMELVGHSVESSLPKSVRRSPVNPWIAALFYFILGAIGGAVSLWVFPNLLIRPAWAQWLNLFASPILVGMMMSWFGSMLRRRGKETFGIDCFPFAALFALGIALVRFLFG